MILGAPAIFLLRIFKAQSPDEKIWIKRLMISMASDK